ncbi:MAG: rRNA maturation RNase YbeY [Candidatus Omnitrophica bacterium]|nr:rRNA maturation RNase YbeY [Candidatus Omnitrophota bacterium]
MKRLKIRIKDNQKRITINKKAIAHLAKQILKIKGIKDAELSILFVGKKRICKLNKEFRKINKPTDVLAFSMREGKASYLHPALPKTPCKAIDMLGYGIKRKSGVNPEILGDVVICPEIARKFAKIYRSTTKKEISLYLTHGILHLLGYDDMNAKSRSQMRAQEQEILNRLFL